ncbi:MAG TPA: hypothetical protein ENK91_13070 [Bacteroidetes bacterium]|nr:hypothetical protein [Bacteroidota bacterium]
MEGKEVTAHFSFKGEYDITLTTFNKGGYATLTKTVTVEKDDPSNCTGNYQLLTNCSSKTWTLAQEAGALVVGPNLDEVWWQSSSQDLEDRFCLFNDKYIFDSNGNYTYDNQGDFYADTDGNGNIFPPELGLTPGCHPSTDWPDNFKDWDSGTHKFTITESTITVSGQGAYIGLYKVGTSSEVDKPQSSVTYNILELSADRMVIYTDYGGLVWKMTLTSSE